MITLEEIFTEIPAKRTILFEEGLWCIYKRQDRGLPDDSFAIHRCSSNVRALNHDWWICGNEDHRSYSVGCGEEAPDSIKTLLILYRWER